MSNWLDKLKQDKERAIEVAKSQQIQLEKERQEKFEETVRAHNSIIALLRVVQVEKLLLQLVNDVIADHPQYPTAYLHRHLYYAKGKGMFSPRAPEDKRYASDYLWPKKEAWPLPDELEFPNGFYITEVSWYLSLYSRTESHYEYDYFLRVSITANGLKINKKTVFPITSENVETAIAMGIENPLFDKVDTDRSP